MYLNGMGFRAIARVTEIDHTTIINWVKEAGESLSDEPQEDEIPEITEIDELQTFVGNKRNKLWSSGYRRKRRLVASSSLARAVSLLPVKTGSTDILSVARLYPWVKTTGLYASFP